MNVYIIRLFVVQLVSSTCWLCRRFDVVFVLCVLFQLSKDERCTPCVLSVGLPGGGASILRSRCMCALCTYLSFRKQCFIFVCYTFVICMSSLQESSLLRVHPMIEADEVTVEA